MPISSLSVALTATVMLAAAPLAPRPATHRFTIERGWLTMRDGVRLSATTFQPTPRLPGERFPTLLEMLPYRKDDSFYLRDFPHYAWFASRGYRMVKVDVRGTGTSSGALPDREYSRPERLDAEELIARLSRAPTANGRVGMWGISWGGFNAIQSAMRAPPALRAILAVDASDDLFHDDVHYIDGILHIDLYQLEIDHENGLPRPPDYPVDAAYLRERLGARPWLLRYLAEQRPGPFWAAGSLRGQYHRLRVPAFLIGGLADGYRDSVLRMLEHVPAPVKAWIGPWNHDFPDSGVPGPRVEWRQEALRWFDHWLCDRDTGVLAEPRLAVFVRAGHAPALEDDAPGAWAWYDWPIASTRTVTLTAAPGARRLVDRPGTGTAAGDWWGETPGDMAADDASALTLDSAPLAAPRRVIGFPRVRVRGRTDASPVHWSARLEDVGPDGRVTLVTGAAHAGPPPFDLPLHFTTWTFRAGHRVRLALSHAQFPMLWPKPRAATSVVRLGADGLALALPEVPDDGRHAPRFFPPARTGERSDAEELSADGENTPARRTFTDPATGETVYEMATDARFRIRDRTYRTTGTLEWRVSPREPAHARALAHMVTVIERPGRRLALTTYFTVRSDATRFHVDFSRDLAENGRRLARRTWHESIPRDGH